jgi:hypothetical protein
MDISPEDRDMMIRTVIGEASDQPDVGKYGVAHVILNRVNKGGYGKTPSDVVLQRGQFEPWQTRRGELAGISKRSQEYRDTGEIVDNAVNGTVSDPTGGMTHFLDPAIVRKRTGRLPDWASGHGLQIGDHTFFAPEGRAAPLDAINKAIGAKDEPLHVMAYDTPGSAGAQSVLEKYGLGGTAGDETPPVPNARKAPDGEWYLNDPVRPGKYLRVKNAPGDRTSENASSGDHAAVLDSYGLGDGSVPKQPLPASMQPPVESATPADVARAGERGLPAQLVGSVPIIGPAINQALAGGSALRPRQGETEPSFLKRWSERSEEQRRADALYAQTYPSASAGANIAGSLATLPLAATTAPGRWMLGMEGSSLGSRIYGGAFGGASINALDAALRGNNPSSAALEGGIGGLAGPIVGEGASGLLSTAGNALRGRSGALANVPRVGIDMLTGALQGETSASLAEARRRMGPAGFLADVNTGMTDLAGGIADTPGPGKEIIREAYRQRAGDAAGRIDAAITRAMGPATNIVEHNQFLTEARKAASDPLYQQFRNMQVAPTPEIKALIPRLKEAGAFDQAKRLSGIAGESVNEDFLTGKYEKANEWGASGDPEKVASPTTQSWDYVKRGLDSKIDQAYAGGDKTLARSLIGLKQNMIDEIEKTPAGQVWKQARGEFADRSALIDQIERGHDDFLGSRSGLTVDELREELRGLSGPELMARMQGGRAAIANAMGDTINGDTTTRNRLLARNNQAKLRLLLGDDRANELIDNLQSERFLSAQDQNVRGGSQTAPKGERVRALQPSPLPPYNPSLVEPLSLIPPHFREMLRPSTVIEGARSQQYENARRALAPILVEQSRPQTIDRYLQALYDEVARRGRVAEVAGKTGRALSGVAVGSAPYVMRRNLGDTPNAQ